MEILANFAVFEGGGVRVEIVDASQSVEKVAAEVWSQVSKMPILG